MIRHAELIDIHEDLMQMLYKIPPEDLARLDRLLPG